MELKNDIFIIPTENNKYIVYMPLRNAIFYATKDAILILKKYIAGISLSEEEKNTGIWSYIKKLESIEPIKPLIQDYIWIQRL